MIKQLKLFATDLPEMSKLSERIMQQSIRSQKSIQKLVNRFEQHEQAIQAMQRESLQADKELQIVTNLFCQLPILYRSGINPVRGLSLK